MKSSNCYPYISFHIVQVSKPQYLELDASIRCEIFQAPPQERYCAAAETPVKYESDTMIIVCNLAASRRQEILW